MKWILILLLGCTSDTIRAFDRTLMIEFHVNKDDSAPLSRFPDCFDVRYHKSLRLVKFVLWFTSMEFIYIVVEIVNG